MSQFLHDKDAAKAIAIPLVFSETDDEIRKNVCDKWETL